MFATDFSACADNAMQYASRIARLSEGKITLLNAFEVPVIAPVNVFTTLEDTMHVVRKEMQTAVERKAGQVAVAIEDLLEEVMIVEDRPVDAIAEKILDKAPDLLVMGTRGTNADRGLFMGSTAAAVIREATCPVLAVPEESSFARIRKIAYATDLKYDESQVIQYLVRFAALFDAELVILHVDKNFSDRAWSLDLLQDLRDKANYDKIFYREIVHEDVFAAINEFVEEYGIDILATTTANTSLFERLMFKSMTKELLTNTAIPMMIFNRKKHDTIFLG